jgi:hypothetical protein
VVLASVIVVLPSVSIKLIGSRVVLVGFLVKLAGSVVVEVAAAGSAMTDSRLATQMLENQKQTSFLAPFRLYNRTRDCCASP